MFIYSHKIETLEQISQLAQDIEPPSGFSSDRRVISKVGEQPSPNIHTTRDSKDKYVICEFSKNAKGSHYFKCQGYGHVAAQYLSSIQLGVVRCSHTTVRDEDWRRSSVFHTYITHEGKNYKLMINGGSCVNNIIKTTLEKMSFRLSHTPAHTT